MHTGGRRRRRDGTTTWICRDLDVLRMSRWSANMIKHVFFVFGVSQKLWAVDICFCVTLTIYRELGGEAGRAGGENPVFDFAHPSGALRTPPVHCAPIRCIMHPYGAFWVILTWFGSFPGPF